ncbi:hypothetical protein BU17DRAFT_92265 [Hysterangium stoloniferum]|nr:hypothetical protein BU17DRAFT_92265 [Hysterangium stoloniferum]
MLFPDSQRQAGPSSNLTMPSEASHTELCGPVAQQSTGLDPLYHPSSPFSTAAFRSPDLSHTSLSYGFSYAEQPLLESNCSLGYPSYFPDVTASSDGLGDGLDNGFTCHLPPSSLSAWMESPDYDFLIIHSPKPVFAYKIFDFDFDRPCSPKDELPPPSSPEYSRKRRRELSEMCEDSPTSLKKQKMGNEASPFISLPPDRYFTLPLYSLRIPSTDVPSFANFTLGGDTFGRAFNFEFTSS